MAVWVVSTAPSIEPLTRAEMKNYLKIPAAVTSDDNLIDSFIKEARMFVERHTSRALITQTVTEYFDSFPTIANVLTPFEARILKLHIAPVQSIAEATGIAYIPQEGTPASYTNWVNTSNSKYFLDTISGSNSIGAARICKVKSVDWPTIEEYTNAVRVIYVAGYGAAATDIPAQILTAMRRLVGAWYYGRKGSFYDDWNMVEDLLSPYKVHK